MSLDTLPSDIIKTVIQFIPNNIQSLLFVSLCKTFYNIGKEFGYIKSLNTGGVNNIEVMDFLTKCCENHKTLHNITLEGIIDPHLWIPISWPKYVSLIRCPIYGYIDSPISNTEYLDITDPHRNKNIIKTVRINWKKFPKLKKLYLYLPLVDLTGIEACQDLEILVINLHISIPLPQDISKLPNLVRLITNCNMAEKTHFVSKRLTECNMGNEQLFTTGAFNIFPLLTTVSRNLNYYR